MARCDGNLILRVFHKEWSYNLNRVHSAKKKPLRKAAFKRIFYNLIGSISGEYLPKTFEKES